MKSIGEFLGRFQLLAHPDQKKETISKFLFMELGLNLTKDQLEIKNNTLFIRADGYTRGEIFLNKERLLKKIKENFPQLNILEIK